MISYFLDIENPAIAGFFVGFWARNAIPGYWDYLLLNKISKISLKISNKLSLPKSDIKPMIIKPIPPKYPFKSVLINGAGFLYVL